MTSFIAAGGSGRFTSFIPAIPAAWSVTTIAFIVHLLVGRSSSSEFLCRPPKYDRDARWSNDLWLWNRCHRRGARKSKVGNKHTSRAATRGERNHIMAGLVPA